MSLILTFLLHGSSDKTHLLPYNRTSRLRPPRSRAVAASLRACAADHERSLNAPFSQHCKVTCYIRLLGISGPGHGNNNATMRSYSAWWRCAIVPPRAKAASGGGLFHDSPDNGPRGAWSSPPVR